MKGWTDGRVESRVARRSDQWSEKGGADRQMCEGGVGGGGREADRGEGDGGEGVGGGGRGVGEWTQNRSTALESMDPLPPPPALTFPNQPLPIS